MKRILFTNAIILLCALPIAGLVGWLSLLAGIGPHYAGVSTFGMVRRHMVAPLFSPIMTANVQTFILAGPLVLFLVLMGISVFKGWRRTSYTFSVLTSLSWVVIVMMAIYARALP